MNTFYDSQNDYRNYLAHYGVKGMKWRRHKATSEDPRDKYRTREFGDSDPRYGRLLRRKRRGTVEEILSDGKPKSSTTNFGDRLRGGDRRRAHDERVHREHMSAESEWYRRNEDRRTHGRHERALAEREAARANEAERRQAEDRHRHERARHERLEHITNGGVRRKHINVSRHKTSRRKNKGI